MIKFFFFALIGAVAVWGAYLWFLFYRRLSRNEFKLEQHASPFGLIDVLLLFLAWTMVPGICVGGLLYGWKQTDLASLSQTQTNILVATTAVSQLLACCLVACYFLKRYGGASAVFGFQTERLGEHIGLAVRWFAMVIPALLCIQWLLSKLVPYEHTTISQLQGSFSIPTLVVTWLGAVIAAPICEEMLFRGVLQGWLQRIRFDRGSQKDFTEITGGWGIDSDTTENQPEFSVDPENPFAASTLSLKESETERPSLNKRSTNVFLWWMPIIASSVLFSLVHIGQGLAPIALFLFGLVLGFLYRQSGSIVPAVLLHLLLNAFSMFWVTLELAISALYDSI